jgi:glycosyltransferase involved in cell wall biosynthesis
MNIKLPLVSVIVPAFNAAQFIGDAVDSIRQQHYTLLEIIVIDDGSTDSTASVVSGLGPDIILERQAHAGPAAARNRGIQQAKGEIIAFLDADDLWPAGKLNLQTTCLMKTPQIDVVMGQVELRCSPGMTAPDLRFTPNTETISHVQLGSAVFRRTVFDRVGWFNESFRFAEDHDWFLRAREQQVQVMLLDEITLYYRWHGQNMMTDAQTARDFFLMAVNRSLERRRQPDHSVRLLPDWIIYHKEDL